MFLAFHAWVSAHLDAVKVVVVVAMVLVVVLVISAVHAYACPVGLLATLAEIDLSPCPVADMNWKSDLA